MFVFAMVNGNTYFYPHQIMKMKRKNAFLFCLFVGIAGFCRAAIETVDTYSASMKKTIKATVVTPTKTDVTVAMPVVYLLHGYGGNYASWTKEMGADLQAYVDQYNMMIVCPDGLGSWYWDSPSDSTYKYETYVATELVQWVDKQYNTIKTPKGRGITGLSMGGHGALYLALKHQDVFGTAGSMSGGVDIRPFPNNWEMSRRLGKQSDEPERWEKFTVINMLHLLTANSLALIIDCGTEDFFYQVNEKLHQELLYRNIPHDYITRPGAHNWPYWRNAIPYQLLFMNKFFRS